MMTLNIILMAIFSFILILLCMSKISYAKNYVRVNSKQVFQPLFKSLTYTEI